MPLLRFSIMIFAFTLAFGNAFAGELHDAARSGDVERINQVLSSGGDVNESSAFGTALHFAVIGNQLEAARALVDQGADVNAASEALGAPLHATAQFDTAAIAKLLIEAGANVEARSKLEFTPLHTAAFRGSPEVARALLEGGADAKALAYSTGTGTFESGYFEPLQLSEKHGNSEVSLLLLAAGGGPRPVESVGDLITAADPGRGRELAYERCKKCHVLEADGSASTNDFSGPSISGIFGQGVATREDFDYSPALAAYGGNWTEDRLYAWILHPMLTVPGVLMPEVKQFSVDDVADVVAYMKAAVN
jgi:cytochrome c